MSVFGIAFTFFLVTNPIGNTPAIVALVKDFSFDQQRKILIREALFALMIAIFFQFCGEKFLGALQIKNYAVTLCGGILLLLTALNMIFPQAHESSLALPKQAPFFVPIATPLLSGPGLMTIIMLYSAKEDNSLLILSAILLAWVGVIGVLASAPYLQKMIGQRGMLALEQLMGMILAMISMEMIVTGTRIFVNTLKT